MIYRAYVNGKEISDFPVKGTGTDQVYGGNTLLWEKDRIIKENVANFCGYSKCISKNGAELLAVSYDRSAINPLDGSYPELFTGEGTYTKRLIEISNGEGWQAVSAEEYFYIIKYKYKKDSVGEYLVTDFYKFDESGNDVYHFMNATSTSIDKLREDTTHKHTHFLYFIRGFYVVSDVFYIIFKITSPEVTKDDDTGWFFVAGYQNGTQVSQKLITDAEDGVMDFQGQCMCQFTNGDRVMLTSNNTFSEYTCSLIEVSGDTFKKVLPANYDFLGAKSGNIYLRKHTTANGEEICLYENGGCKIVKALNDHPIAVTFSGNMMYVDVILGSINSPVGGYVMEIDTKTFEKTKIIYKLSASKKKYAHAGIRQVTSKNGKIYAHKECLRSIKDDMEELSIDEITLRK